jgi:hypothetical protein
MAPSYCSVNQIYRTVSSAIVNYCYFSDLDEFIISREDEIDVWVHGHMHLTSDYSIGKVRVLCNPRGYSPYEYTGFDPQLRIDVAPSELIVRATPGLMPYE